MEPTHPNKTTVSIMMVALAIFAVAIPFSSGVKMNQSKNTPLVLRTSDELRLLSSDRDGNNVEDWRDLILDSMSSSTKEAFTQAEPNKEAEARLADKNNVTASFSKNIYTAAAYVNSNPNLTDDDKANLVAEAVRAEAPKTQPKVYIPSDLKVTSSDSIEAKKSYGNTMALLLKRANSEDLGSNDLVLLEAYTKEGDKSLLLPLATKGSKVEETLDELLSAPVPPSAVVFHLRLVNSVSTFSSTLEAFASADSDPLRSLAFLNTYPDTVTKLFTSMSDVQDYFVLQEIQFLPTDPGYIFINRK